MTYKRKIRREIEKRYEYWREKEHNSHSIESEIRMSECQHLLLLFNSLQEEPVSKDLEEAADKHLVEKGYLLTTNNGEHLAEVEAKGLFKAGAQWQKEHPWKPADGDDLPEIDREVIALIEAFGHYKVIFAHRVDENAEIHTSIDGKPLVLHPKKNGKGGWNIPDVKFWLDCELPKMEE